MLTMGVRAAMNLVQTMRQPAGATRLVLRCLGRFRLERSDGESLALRTRKARAMLACLALSGRPATRDSLADLLWSDRAPAQARSSVRQALFELQHLGGDEESVLAVTREEVTVRPELVVTDLQLIRAAARDGDWARLAVLLDDSQPGLLTDLDGLDSEFDGWLRTERAQEPARTFAMLVAAADRCRAQAGPRAALGLVTEIVRLDPVNEEAARIALEIDHELGDSAALHRHFQMLRDRLREDYDAEPSAETVALFKRLANGGAAPDLEPGTAPARMPEPRQAVEAEPAEPAARARSRPASSSALLVWLALALAALAALVVRDRSPVPAAARPVLLAVLPFEQQPSGDGFLASGLWEHTRAALTRNGSLRVLGRSTTAAMADQQLSAREYRRRFGVTHLLEGSVRRSGPEVLVSVSLSRTSDGVAVWQKMFAGRMGEPFALQDSIATGIEGRLRGILAPSGGRRAEHISTIPEVYGLYSESRQLIASRRRGNYGRAEALMRKAVAMDPNYAPAWSLLGAAIYFNGRIAIVDSRRREQALEAVRRALDLAPNLAQAHATRALIEGEHSPAAEQALRRAVALDPSYAEAWNWLGNALSGQYRYPEAIAAYQRAVAIDPLLAPAVINIASIATQSGDRATVDRSLRDVARAGGSALLIGGARAKQHSVAGDYSQSVKVLLELGLDANGNAGPGTWYGWLEALTGLGEFERMHRITNCPDWYAPLLAGKALPPREFEGRPVEPEEFWTSTYFSHPASRAMVNLGRPAELVQLYRGVGSADDFISRIRRRGMLAGLAPTLAVALTRTGEREEAAYLLAAAANTLEPALGSRTGGTVEAELAMIRAAQGEDRQALALLESGIRNGWIPDGRSRSLDLAQEPALNDLRGDRRFEALRRRILAHIARERAELGPLTV